MTYKQFFQKVAALRQIQKEYFKTRSSESLRQAKAIEHEIDDEIKRINNLPTTPQSDSNPPSDTATFILGIVSNIIRDKKDLGIVPCYATSIEIHQLVNTQLDKLVVEGRLTPYSASVNRIPAFDFTLST